MGRERVMLLPSCHDEGKACLRMEPHQRKETLGGEGAGREIGA